MRKVIIFMSFLGIILLLSGGFSKPSRYEGKIVKKIEFSGLKNVDDDDLLDVMITEEGYPLKASEIREDIKAVFVNGNMKNIRVEVEEFAGGVKVRFICEERMLVNEIIFKGIDELIEQELTEVISIKEGEPLREDLVKRSVEALKKKYEEEGLFNAVIDYKIVKDKDEDYAAKVIFIIDEGEEIKVEKISILGAKKVSAGDLKSFMELEEEGIFADGAFKKEVYEQDKGKIIAYYKQLGYLDAQIVEDTIDYQWEDPEKKGNRVIFVTIKVTEGEVYYFDKYTIAGNKVIETKNFEKFFQQTESGEVFNDTLFQMDRYMISRLYANQGYIFARVIPKKTIDEREVVVDGKKVKRKYVKIDFEIVEGNKAYIENIIIKGNKKTKDKVIRRELLVKEGELFNSDKMERSRQMVFNLGFFKEVNFDIRPGSSEDFMNLIVDVEEQPTGTISLGGGYGTRTGFSIFADIGENNLLGYGHRIGTRFEYGPLRSSITISYRWPWLFDLPVTLTGSIFYTIITYKESSMFSSSNETAEFQKQAYGYSVGLSYRFWDYYGVGTIWRQAFKSSINPTGNSTDERFIDVAMGVQDERTLTFYLYRDTRDNYMNPSSGWRAEFSVAFTGGYIIRGDDHYIKYSPDLFIYYSPFNLPFLKTHPCVIELRGNASFIKPPLQQDKVEKLQRRDSSNTWLKPEDRLIIGGPETLRAWGYLDSDFPESWQNGLFHRILYGAEFRIPIHPQMLWFAFFFDAGSLWSDTFWEQTLSTDPKNAIAKDKENGLVYDIKDINDADIMSYFKYSWGFGFKIQIPMMPLRFWFGKKLKWVGKDYGYFQEISGYEFQFGIGDMRF